MFDYDGKERLTINEMNLKEINKRIKPIHKSKLNDLMCDFISDNDIDNENDIRVIRQFVKFLKEQ